MSIESKFLGWTGTLVALVALGQVASCTTEDTDPEDMTAADDDNESPADDDTTGDDDATGDDDTTGDDDESEPSPTPTPSGGAACANAINIPSSTPGIADFDAYDGSTPLAGDTGWSFAFGGDTALMLYAGTFVYGDEADGFPETYEMVDGSEGSTYALSISDSLAEEYGGGLGLWLSDCLNASAFDGISFWVRGNAPTGTGTIKVSLEETTPEVEDGPCDGDVDTCIHPSFEFPVTDTWTEVKVSWADFQVGDANGTPVPITGDHITQFGFDVGLEWLPDEAGEYFPTPAEYEFAIDTLSFY